MSAAEKHFKEWCVKPENVLKSTYDWAQEYAELYASHERERMLEGFTEEYISAPAAEKYPSGSDRYKAFKRGAKWMINHLKQNR